jgi:hypothetical protein
VEQLDGKLPWSSCELEAASGMEHYESEAVSDVEQLRIGGGERRGALRIGGDGRRGAAGGAWQHL